MADRIAPTLWEAYCSTRVQLDIAGVLVDVRPIDRSMSEEWPSSDDWPWSAEQGEVFIISAANPFSAQLSEAENVRREAQMEAELGELGLSFRRCVGHGADGEWSETSLVVLGATAQQIRDLAESYEQNAYFRWTPDKWEVVSVVSNQHFTSSWRIAAVA